jgi:hypothetical protein
VKVCYVECWAREFKYEGNPAIAGSASSTGGYVEKSIPTYSSLSPWPPLKLETTAFLVSIASPHSFCRALLAQPSQIKYISGEFSSDIADTNEIVYIIQFIFVHSLLKFTKTCLNLSAIPQGIFSSLSLNTDRILETLSSAKSPIP